MARFRLKSSRVLEAHLAGDIARAITGAMVAYDGDVSFKSTSIGGSGGLGAAVKRRMSGESLQLMDMKGHGTVYLAKAAMEIHLIQLTGNKLHVESSSLLAMSAELRTDVVFAGLRGASSGQGLFTTTVSGNGEVALLSDGPMIALAVSPQYPLVVDPDAFIAHQGQVSQTFITDISWRNAIGEGSGEAFSLRFEGTGVVYIQPAER